MTEEEHEKKAEEYFDIVKEKKIPFTVSNINKCIKQSYKDGYEQGQKDDKKFCASFCLKGGKIEQLKKENEELKKQIESLKTEQKDILEDNDYWQDMFSKSDKENAELKAQIEKMK